MTAETAGKEKAPIHAHVSVPFWRKNRQRFFFDGFLPDFELFGAAAAFFAVCAGAGSEAADFGAEAALGSSDSGFALAALAATAAFSLRFSHMTYSGPAMQMEE